MTKVLAIIATLLCLALPVAAGIFFLSASDQSESANPAATSAEPEAATEPAVSTPATPTAIISRNIRGMQCDTIVEGSGSPAGQGDEVSVHYTGWTDGFYGRNKFDSSRDRGSPITFTLGTGAVIQGWDLGVPGMRPGEVRRLTIPADLGYGARAQAKIPANSTLYFEVEYVGLAQR